MPPGSALMCLMCPFRFFLDTFTFTDVAATGVLADLKPFLSPSFGLDDIIPAFRVSCLLSC